MSRCMWLAAALSVLAVGCGRADRNLASRGSGAMGPDDFAIGEPIRHANLTIFPVVSKMPRNENPFITLDEGLKAGALEIREMGSEDQPNQARQQSEPSSERTSPFDEPAAPTTANANPTANEPSSESRQTVQSESGDVDQSAQGRASDVNHLLVLNRSNKPLYLMPGEIIVGGQQDRVIGTEVVVQPSDKPQTIDVFCVEHGRWHHRTAADLASVITTQTWNDRRESSEVYPVADLAVTVSPEAENPAKASEEAAKGKFIATVGNVSKASRLAVQESGDQSTVWENVAKQNVVSGVASATQTGAFTKNYSDDDTLKKLEPLMEKMKNPVADTENIVGVIVAVDGKIDSMDVFQSTPLFRQLWPKLLKSYVLDAVNAQNVVAEGATSSPAECTKSAAEQFLTKAFNSEEDGTETKSNVAVTTRRGQGCVSFSAGLAGESAGGMGGGGFGGGVHTSAFSK